MERDIDLAYEQCIALANKIKHKILRNVAINWLNSNKEKLVGIKGSDWQHHNYAGGLIAHIQSVTEISRQIAMYYSEKVSLDLITFCALLHDAGKVEDYSLDDTFEIKQETRMNQNLLGHSYEGAHIVEVLLKEEFEKDGSYSHNTVREIINQCVHCVGSHMIGYGAIEKQKMLEVFILGKADHIDAELSQTIMTTGEDWFETASGNRYYRSKI